MLTVIATSVKLYFLNKNNKNYYFKLSSLYLKEINRQKTFKMFFQFCPKIYFYCTSLFYVLGCLSYLFYIFKKMFTKLSMCASCVLYNYYPLCRSTCGVRTRDPLLDIPTPWPLARELTDFVTIVTCIRCWIEGRRLIIFLLST